MRRFLVIWAFNVAALFVASWVLDGIDYGDSAWALVLAGLVFSLVNMVVRPIVTLLALPLILITLGLAYFFVNLLMLYLTDWIVGDFEIEGFWWAVAATIIIWIVNTFLSALLAGLAEDDPVS